MSVKKLPKRSEIDDALKWDLGAIFSSVDAWEATYKETEQIIVEMAKYNEKPINKENLKTVLDIYAKLMRNIDRLFVYAYMTRDQDNRDSVGQTLADRAQSIAVQAETACAFLTPAILKMPVVDLEACINDENFSDYDFFLKDLLKTKPHVLSPEMEGLLAMTGEVMAAPKQIFTMLNNADIKFGMVKGEDGIDIELTKGRYLQLMESNNPSIRELAFKTLYKSYIAQTNTITETYKSSVKKDAFMSKARKYESSIQQALDVDDVALEVYDNLISSVESGLPAMYKYLAIRQKMLNQDELHMYDIYVPLVEEPDLSFDFETAKKMVEEGLAPLGEEYLSVLREGYDNHWIDVYETDGKTGGAYSWGTYGSHPYVLLNHRDTLDGVMTLAHEMGHAIHSYYSDKALPFIKAQYRIFVAEVASTLNEILLTRHLLKTLEDPIQKAYIINQYLEQFRGTVFRQTMFAKFEKETHAMVERGDVLTAEALNDLYLELNKLYYGPDMVYDDEIKSEWMRIPHFYNAFYVYKYATGFSAAAAIAERILTEGQPAVDDYLKFLSSGGSDYPIELLKIAGVDMSSSEPVEKALNLFEKMVDEFEVLIKTK